ncbi:cytochrome P450 [Halomonas cupida]|uniref:cytochrome P450 n=1 Tax=Halomonas cupida TaxID=44933 RepID=UPI003A8DB487
MNPLDAPALANPYPWYARLRQQGDLLYHQASRHWVASTAHAVTTLLNHPGCRVRPLDTPVPLALGEGPAATLFSRLMRMNEGNAHRCPRQRLAAPIQRCTAADVSEETHRVATQLMTESQPLDLNHIMFQIPVTVVARLLGIRPDEARLLPRLTADFSAGFSADVGEVETLHRAHLAAEELLQRFKHHLSSPYGPVASIQPATNAESSPDNRTRTAANLAGLLVQTFEATAGLVGNTLITLASRPALMQRVVQRHVTLSEVIAEVVRHDPPIQLTRRYMAEDSDVLGQQLPANASIILLLASANRDSQANEEGERFILERPSRRCFSFGAGSHHCPGETLATTIAGTTVQLLLQSGQVTPAQLRWHYKPSPNARIPVFEHRNQTEAT